MLTAAALRKLRGRPEGEESEKVQPVKKTTAAKKTSTKTRR